jgi:response regulator RpfG family c-di-GMP phosphodiesterase
MSIDERIEALTQSMELLASLHRDLEESTAKTLAAMAAETRERHAETEEHMAQLAETMNRLGAVVLAHERRLNEIEGQ